jgi:hypothetical protein
MSFDELRQELDDLTAIANPAERLMAILRFMSLCSGLQAAGMLDAAKTTDADAEADELIAEMNDLANACLPLAASALDEVVRGAARST